MNQKGSILVISLIILLVILGVSTCFLFKNFYPSSNHINSSNKSPDLNTGSLLSEQVDNFDNLTLEDLPNLTDIRGIFRYKDKLIIGGLNRIVEYDPVQKKITRMNNKLLGCIDDFEVVGNELFVACHNPISNSVTNLNGIYKINLESGKLIQKFIEGENNFPGVVNATFAFKDGHLWVGAYQGVFKLNLKTNEITSYTPTQLGTDCDWPRMYANENYVWTVPQSGGSCGAVASVYQPESDTWIGYKNSHFVSDNPSQITSAYNFIDSPNNIYISYADSYNGGPNFRMVKYNSTKKDWDKVVSYNDYDGHLPLKDKYFPESTSFRATNNLISHYFDERLGQEFIATDNIIPLYKYMSNNSKGAYYLLTEEGVYSLVKNGFPTKLIDLNNPLNYRYGSYDSTIQPYTYVTKDDKFILLIGPNDCGMIGYQECPYLGAELVNLQSGTVKDLITLDLKLEDKTQDKINNSLEKLTNISFEEKDEILLLLNQDKTLFGEVNLKTQTFTISQ